MKFAERLRSLRDAVGLSEAQLAKASEVSFSSIHEYGLGRRKPSFEAVVKIARALGVTCESFADCSDIAPIAGKPKRKGKKGPSGS
jgi:transcriptional regulator with XRE-family HTH domain